MARIAWLLLFLIAATANDLRGQRADLRWSAVTPTPSTSKPFLVEAAGGVAGSLVGLGIGYLFASSCDVEDLGCHLKSAFGAIALGTGGAATGTMLAGNAVDTNPSLFGAGMGAVAGAGAGIGLWHLFTEELDLINKTDAAVLILAITQGAITALGSRTIRSLSR